MSKFAFALIAFISISFIAVAASHTANAGRCWNAGSITCCLTPEGVICH